jgi:hypothetical protein
MWVQLKLTSKLSGIGGIPADMLGNFTIAESVGQTKKVLLVSGPNYIINVQYCSINHDDLECSGEKEGAKERARPRESF